MRSMQNSADKLAAQCADVMWRDDHASQALGMKIEQVGAGRAVLAMTVTKAMTNGHGTCHGGYIFTLADSAFAFACNSYNQRAVAGHCSITFVAPALEADRLVASAVEQSRFGRNGIYDVTVTREDGAEVARFRGHSRTVAGVHIEPDASDPDARNGEVAE